MPVGSAVGPVGARARPGSSFGRGVGQVPGARSWWVLVGDVDRRRRVDRWDGRGWVGRGAAERVDDLGRRVVAGCGRRERVGPGGSGEGPQSGGAVEGAREHGDQLSHEVREHVACSLPERNDPSSFAVGTVRNRGGRVERITGGGSWRRQREAKKCRRGAGSRAAAGAGSRSGSANARQSHHMQA